MNPKLQMFFDRRSVRRYTDADVPEETVRDLLEAAMAAPSAVAKDPWHFVVVRDKACLARLAEGLPNGKMLADAAVGIMVCGSIDEAHGNLESYMLQDCSAAIENLLLAASALGLGACWLGVHPRTERMEHLKEVLALPDGIVAIAGIAIGWPVDVPEARTRYRDDKVQYERW